MQTKWQATWSLSLRCLKSLGHKWEQSNQAAPEIPERRGHGSSLLILKAFWACSPSTFPRIDVLLWNQVHDFFLVSVLLNVSFLSLPTNTVILPSYGGQNKKFPCNINQRKSPILVMDHLRKKSTFNTNPGEASVCYWKWQPQIKRQYHVPLVTTQDQVCI